MPTNAMLWDAPNNRWQNIATGATVVVTPPAETFEFTVMPGGNDARGWTKNQSYDAVAAALGRDLGGRIKFFSSGAISVAVSNKTVDTSHSTEPYPIYCFKSWNLSQFNAFLNTLDHVCAVCYEHEYYTTVQSEWDAYNAVYAAMKAARDAHANGHFVELQAMSSMSQHRNNPGYFAYADATNFDSWGADTYNAKATTPYTASQCFDDQYTAWQAMKAVNPSVKWRVAEYGLSRLISGGGSLWTGAQRIAYIEGHISYAKDLGCSSIGFWAVDNTADAPIKDWSIDKGTAADDATAAYMAGLLTSYPVQGV
jgi:hypothetical protein